MSLANTMHELLQPLLAAQRYAVLATDHGGQPYTSLMAFAASEDLQDLTLVTERATQKYANLTANSRVAVFIDNRENVGADTHEAVAVTAIGAAQEVTGHRLGRSDLGDIALRLLADHTRSTAFLISDGVIPSNEDRGYVLRRIMRRAMRHAQLLGAKDPLMWKLVPALVREMGQAYPCLLYTSDAADE